MATNVEFLEQLRINLVSGGIAGVVGASTMFPVDMVKSRLQASRPGQYKGALDCAKALIRNEGIIGLYRGLAVNLVGIIPEKALKLAVNDVARVALKSPDEDSLPIGKAMLAGAIAGAVQGASVTAPMELIKLRMQTQVMLGHPKQSALEIIKELGVRGVYKGTGVTLMRDIPFSMIFFALYGRLNDSMVDPETGKTALVWSMVSGGVAGATAALVGTPMDVLKTNYQKRGNNKNLVDTAVTIYQREGPRAFIKGAGPRMAIVGPLFAISLMVYEGVSDYYHGKTAGEME